MMSHFLLHKVITFLVTILPSSKVIVIVMQTTVTTATLSPFPGDHRSSVLLNSAAKNI